MNRVQRLLLVVIGLAVVVTLLPEMGKTGENNLYALQAEAFWHGRLDLLYEHHDVAVVDGRYYVPFPPFPALLLLPFVALFGVNHTYPVLISLALTVLNIYLFRRILQKLEIAADSIFWLTLAFFFGTGYWYVMLNTAGVWYFAHIVAISCMLLAILAALDGRTWLVGLMVGCAFLCRQFNLFNALFLWVLLLESRPPGNWRERAGQTLNFGLALGLCVVIYMLFNMVRFGSPLDTGYAYLPQVFFLKDRVAQYGLFSLAYVPFNFFHMFVNGFWVKFTDPTQTRTPEMELLGTSIIAASPFLLAAFWARWRPALLAAAWASIGVITVGLLLYFVNGWTQVNTQRYTLDFTPVLMLLVALGTKRITGNWWKWAVVYAVGLNILALVIVPFLNWLLS